MQALAQGYDVVCVGRERTLLYAHATWVPMQRQGSIGKVTFAIPL